MDKESANKENILRTAVNLFAHKGYDAVGIQEICTDSGITKPTLYYYFKSKQGLLQAITDTYGTQLYQVIEESLRYEHDFIKSLTLVLKGVVNFACDNKEFFQLHINLCNSPCENECAIIYDKIKTQISDAYLNFFINSTNEFGNMRGKETLYSILFENSVNQCAISVLSKKIKCDDETIYHIIHSFVYGVAN